VDCERQPDCDTYRLVMSRKDGVEVLLVPIGAAYLLPSVQVSRRERFSDCLTSAIRDSWGRKVVCLFSPDLPPIETVSCYYHVVECCGCASAVNGNQTEWVSFSRLSPDSFVDLTDYKAVHQALTTWERHSNGFEPGPFAKPGWFEELRTWADDAIRPLGYQLKSDFRQLNASPKFSLIRLATSGPAVWFKAVGEPNLREFSISKTLAELVPDYVPKIIASRPDWNAWLAIEAVGNSLRDLEGWKTAARALAVVQITSMREQSQLLRSGAHDLRATALSGTLGEFLSTIGALMEQQTKIAPPALSWKEVRLLGEQIEDALACIVKLGIPDSLGHLDLNPDNIMVSSGSCTFLDWAEGYVGHPFFSFNYLLEHFRRYAGTSAPLEIELLETYAEPWTRVLSETSIATALSYAPLVAVFAYAIAITAEARQERRHRLVVVPYLRSLTRRMKYEADQLIIRGIPCPQ
jgi:hypothetical protein